MRKVLYIFGLLSDADIEWLARHGVRRFLADGEVVMEEGRRSDDLVLLLEGRLQASAEGSGEIARLGAGEIVGEISLVDSAPPSATITALGEGHALFIDKAVLRSKLDRDDGFAARFYRALAIFLADRLRANRSGRAARLDDEGIADDELDEQVIDQITAAGERFNRLLQILASEPRAPTLPMQTSRGSDPHER